MKKKTKEPRVKVNPDTFAKAMKKRLGEHHAKQLVKYIASSSKNFNPADINLKDIFDLKEVKKDQAFWEQVNNILHK